MDNPQTEKEKKIDSWINHYRCEGSVIAPVQEYVIKHGRKLECLLFWDNVLLC